MLPQRPLLRRALVGGIVGSGAGCLLAAAEVLLVGLAFGGVDAGLPLFVVGLYGVGGAAVGTVAGGMVARLGEAAAAAAGAVALGSPLLFLGVRFHLRQFLEISGMTGLLLAAGAGAAWALALGGAAWWRRRDSAGTLAALSAAVVAVCGLVAGGFSLLEPDPRHFAGEGGGAKGPNVLILMVDTLRWDALGAYGSSLPTPAMDSLAADGVVFERGYSASAWTRPAVASIFSSTLPSSHGVGYGAAVLSDEVETFAEVASGAGWATAAVFNNINVNAIWNLGQGFDTQVVRGAKYPLGAPMSATRTTVYGTLVNRLRGLSTDVGVTAYTPVDVLVDDAKAIIEARRDTSWMLYLHLMEPHDPYHEHPSLTGSGPDYGPRQIAHRDLPHPQLEMADEMRALYEGEVVFMDRHLAGFLGWLRESGEYDDTLIILTSDHGEEFADHGGFWHGATLYEEQIRVPLLVKFPGGAHRGTRVSGFARTLDLGPTIAAALGLDAPEAWVGHDLAAMLPGRGDGDRQVVAESPYDGDILVGIIEGGTKLVRANEGNKRGLASRELYDVVADPSEDSELLATGRPVRGEYAEDLAARLDSDLGRALDEAVGSSTAGGVAGGDAGTMDALRVLGYVE